MSSSFSLAEEWSFLVRAYGGEKNIGRNKQIHRKMVFYCLLRFFVPDIWSGILPIWFVLTHLPNHAQPPPPLPTTTPPVKVNIVKRLYWRPLTRIESLCLCIAKRKMAGMPDEFSSNSPLSFDFTDGLLDDDVAHKMRIPQKITVAGDEEEYPASGARGTAGAAMTSSMMAIPERIEIGNFASPTSEIPKR